MKNKVSMEKIISLAKRRGFVYPSSEIYGGLANAWDYGPLGIELKNNIKKLWWKNFVHDRLDIVGLDSAILMNPRVWEASGHLGGFSDPLMDCKACKSRHRADKLLEEYYSKNELKETSEGLSKEILKQKIDEHGIKCSVCGNIDFTEIRDFNLMFKTFQGVTEDSVSVVYLRPETAQGIFINFKNVQTTSRKKVPFGIAQIGKSFRNEITPGNFTFRTREFEQMEMEYFCHPKDSLEQFEKWQEFCVNWLKEIGIKEDAFRLRKHEKEELSHYSQATTDIEFNFPFGWGELWGIAHRGDFDLNQHQDFSNKSLIYSEPISNEKYVPHVIEPSLGVDRLALALLINAYEEEDFEDGKRVVLRFTKQIAPVQVAVLPLSKKLNEKAKYVYEQINKDFVCDYDESGNIGKRYRRQDEIGTPICVTIDFDTLEDHAVTIRDRDTMAQDRVASDQLNRFLKEQLID